jgi:arabinan endo-1,5-alpha-L-arabinosidase
MFLTKIVTGLLASVAALASGVAAYADPGSCSGDCWAHDPAVIQRTSDGEYFRFNTGSLIGIWKSSALEGPWVYQGAAIPAGSSINLAGNDDLWVSILFSLCHQI